MNKPYHLMTPAERTAARIAQNRAISEKIAAKGLTETSAGKKGSPRVSGVPKRPPASSTTDYVRATPDELAERRGLIRQLKS